MEPDMTPTTCLICGYYCESRSAKSIAETNLQTLTKLIRYPDGILGHDGGGDSVRTAGRFFMEPELESAQICDDCESGGADHDGNLGLQELGRILGQLEELHQKITDYQKWIVLQIQEALETRDVKVEGGNLSVLVDGARSRIMAELKSRLHPLEHTSTGAAGSRKRKQLTLNQIPVIKLRRIDDPDPDEGSFSVAADSHKHQHQSHSQSQSSHVHIEIKQEPLPLPEGGYFVEDEDSQIPEHDDLSPSPSPSSPAHPEDLGSDSDGLEWMEPKKRKRGRPRKRKEFLKSKPKRAPGRPRTVGIPAIPGLPGTCPFCGKICTSSTYKSHIATHTRPFKCIVADCKAAFAAARDLRGHCIKVHPELGVPGFQCPHCPFKTNFKVTLNMHVGWKHDQGQRVSCPETGCGYSAPRRSYVKKHIEKVHPGKKHALSSEHEENVTGSSSSDMDNTSNRQALNKLTVVSPPNSSKDFCNKTDQEEATKALPRKGRPLKSVKIQNPKDSASINSKVNRKRGRPRTVPKSCACPFCGRACTNTTYNNHIATHTRPFKCTVADCGLSFSSPRNLRGHSIRIHPELGTPGFVCSHCPFSTNFQETLKRHVFVRHGTEDKFACTVPGCNYKPTHPYYMKHHMKRVHEGKRDFLCTECGLGFYTQSQLLRHSITKGHGGEGGSDGMPAEKPFICELCGKGFMRKEMLEYHEGTHVLPKERLRPHVCHLCGVRFPAKGNLSRHIRRWHKGGREHIGERPKRKSPLDVDGECDLSRHSNVAHPQSSIHILQTWPTARNCN